MARKIKQYSVAELINLFELQRLIGNHSHPLLHDWLSCETTLNVNEQYLFDMILVEAQEKIEGWHEEDLKMQFIAFILKLANLNNSQKKISTLF